MFDEQSKEYQIFIQLFKTKATKTTYVYQLNQFKKWLEIHSSTISSWNKLVNTSSNNIHKILMDYLVELKNRNLKYSSILNAFASIEFLLDVNNVNYNKKYVHRFFPTKNKSKGEQAYTLKDIQAMLRVTKTTRDRALLLVITTSGIRSGAIPTLKYGHVQDIENCKKLTVYAGDNEEYITFITPEASEALDAYLQERRSSGEKLDRDSPLFRRSSYSRKLYDYDMVGPIQRASIWAIFTRLVKSGGVVDDA
jgi:integrase